MFGCLRFLNASFLDVVVAMWYLHVLVLVCVYVYVRVCVCVCFNVCVNVIKNSDYVIVNCSIHDDKSQGCDKDRAKRQKPKARVAPKGWFQYEDKLKIYELRL